MTNLESASLWEDLRSKLFLCYSSQDYTSPYQGFLLLFHSMCSILMTVTIKLKVLLRSSLAQYLWYLASLSPCNPFLFFYPIQHFLLLGYFLPRAMSPKSNPRRSNQAKSKPRSHFHQLQQEPQGHQDGVDPTAPPTSPFRISGRGKKQSPSWGRATWLQIQESLKIRTPQSDPLYKEVWRKIFTPHSAHSGCNCSPCESWGEHSQ